MEKEQAIQIMERKEADENTLNEAKKTLEDARQKEIEDERLAEEERIENEKLMAERKVKNEATADKIKKQLVKDIEDIHFIEGESTACEKCGNNLVFIGTGDAFKVIDGQKMQVSAEIYRCKVCLHVETFHNGLRLRRINKGTVFDVFR